MKQVINGVVMTAITFMVIAAVMIASGRSVRKNELEKALEQAAEQAAEELIKKENQKITREECIEMLNNNLAMGIESDSVITVSIMAVDTEKGLISVRAEEEFQNPLGKVNRVRAERTLLLENYSMEKKETVTITYKVGKMVYKVYTLTEGSALPIPVNPEGNFVQWVDESGHAVELESMTADSDKIFAAQMNL